MRSIGEAKLAGLSFLEITPRLMDTIIQPRNLKGDYLIYDGIKVYVEGTRQALEKLDAESVLDR